MALIPDGNRRWAEKHGINLQQAYDLGIKKFVDFGEWLIKMGVKTLTAWALSTENVANRDKKELNILYNLYIKAVNDPKIIEKLKRNRIHVNIIGNLSVLPKRVRIELHKLETITSTYRDNTINLLVAYGGREDIEHAIEKIAAERRGRSKHMRISEDEVKRSLLTAAVPDVDMVIRTSGEKRLSGLLPWQCSYSELYFAKKYWPEFNRRDLKRAVDSFSKRNRRFGR
ncbi:MAG: polyprenyl diphosphate synthase [Candidatus Micrarchaeaceae archaeon]